MVSSCEPETPSDLENDGILRYLYQKYYVDFEYHSAVTSSHWSSIGQHSVQEMDGHWNLAGVGFGSVVPPTSLNQIKKLPQTLLLNQLLRCYAPRSSLVSIGKKIARQTDRLFDFDCVKQILSLDLVLKNIPKNTLRQPVICVIGDGYGYLTSLIHRVLPEAKVLCINLGRTLFFDVYYTKMITNVPLGLITHSEKREAILEQSAVSFIEAENFDWLEGLPIDIFMNIASMQEMNNSVIKRYFELMRTSQVRHRYFYCCNRLQKNLPDGEVTCFSQYPWNADDKIIIDELCSWYQRYPASLPPFWRSFDGPTQHRLVQLSSS